MKKTVLATYHRTSTLWKNANAFYKMQDWVIMECVKYDYSEEMNNELQWIDSRTGEDITDQQNQKLYGKPYVVTLYTAHRRNSKSFCFESADEANKCFKEILHQRL